MPGTQRRRASDLAPGSWENWSFTCFSCVCPVLVFLFAPVLSRDHGSLKRAAFLGVQLCGCQAGTGGRGVRWVGRIAPGRLRSETSSPQPPHVEEITGQPTCPSPA